MARRPWSGIGAITRLGRDERVGLVLSGGGSKASFQIGALRYLYEVAGLKPDVFVGTSAGSILVAMLAQSADPVEQADSVRRLEALWLGMERQSDMFAERSWFRRFRVRVPELMALVTGTANSAGPTPPRAVERAMQGVGRLAPRLSLPFGRTAETKDAEQPVDGEQTDGDRAASRTPGDDEVRAADPETAPGQASSPQEAAEQVLTPQLETLALATSDPTPTGPELTLAQVVAVLSGLTRMRGVSADLGAILSGAEKTRSMYIPGPILRELLGSGMFSSARVATSGLPVRISMVALESGELHFMRGDGYLVDRDDRPIGGTCHDFSRGVLASCSIPMVFAPVRIDDQTYVDGGVRENVPAEMAIGPLGCTTTWVITSSAPGAKRAESFEHKDMVSVMMRATEIGSDETERDEVAYARSAGARVIEPEVDVHDSLTVDPGLIRINIDYGWMRAAEQHLDVTSATQTLVRGIIAGRRRMWDLERTLLDPDVPHDERDLLLLMRLKHDLREQVSRLPVGMAPEGADQWWKQWEAHTPPAAIEPPWLV